MNTKMIVLDEQALQKIIDTILEEYREKIGAFEHKWINEAQAKALLGVRSKSTMQKLRDTDAIVYSQPMHKVVLYDRNSILEYLEAHSNRS